MHHSSKCTLPIILFMLLPILTSYASPLSQQFNCLRWNPGSLEKDVVAVDWVKTVVSSDITSYTTEEDPEFRTVF